MGRILKRRPGYTDFYTAMRGKTRRTGMKMTGAYIRPNGVKGRKVSVFSAGVPVCAGGGCYTPGRQ
jgi:hypothetical protein